MIIAIAVVASLFATAGLGFVPILYSRALRAEGDLAPLNSQLVGLRADLANANSRLESAEIAVNDAQKRLTNHAQLNSKLASVQATLNQMRLVSDANKRALADERARADSLSAEVKRASANNAALLAIQEALGVANANDAIASLRESLKQFKAASQSRDEYIAVARSAGARTPQELRERVLSMQREAQRQSSPIAAAPVIPAGSQAAYCAMPAEQLPPIQLGPGEVLLGETGWYPVANP